MCKNRGKRGWILSRGKRIILWSRYDFAGSGYRITEAVNLTTNHHVEYVVLAPFKYPEKLPRYPAIGKYTDKTIDIYPDDINRLQWLLDQADVIHFKGDSVPELPEGLNLHLPPRVKVVVTVAGTFFRRGENVPEAISQPIAEIQEYVLRSDARTTMTPELNYPDYDGKYIPQSYDSTVVPYSYDPPDLQQEPLRIAHSPSDSLKKGTNVFQKACEVVQEEGYKVETDIYSKVSYQESIDRKRAAHVFFDQNLLGWYGNSALEAMAAGVPVMAHLSDQATQQAGDIGQPPIIETGQTVESMADALRSLFTQDLGKISEETKAWCDTKHSYEATGKQYGELYNRLTKE